MGDEIELTAPDDRAEFSPGFKVGSTLAMSEDVPKGGAQ
jgi:hypothetical protein